MTSLAIENLLGNLTIQIIIPLLDTTSALTKHSAIAHILNSSVIIHLL